MQRKETSKREMRKQYSKPEIRKIALEPQECLAAGCKTLTIGATGSGTSCDLMSCSSLGS